MKKLSAIILCILSVLVLFQLFFLMPCSSTLSSPFWALLFLSPFSSLRVGRSDLLAPSPPLSPPSSFPPWVFFSGFFQASCHTTANSWNSCPPLASNKRLQEGDEAAENKQRGKKIRRKPPTDSLFYFLKNHNNKIKYYSTCPPAGLLTGVWPGKPVQMFQFSECWALFRFQLRGLSEWNFQFVEQCGCEVSCLSAFSLKQLTLAVGDNIP